LSPTVAGLRFSVMVAVVLFALIFMSALAVLLARYATNPQVVRAAERDRDRVDRRPRIAPPALRSLVIELLDALGLEVREEEVLGADRLLVAYQRSAPLGGTRYVVLIVAQPPGDQVEQPQVVELAEQVKAERGAVGLLVTPYTIELGGLAGLEVPVELIDGPRLRELVSAHLPSRLSALDGYRGFAPPTLPTRPLEPQHA
jgi:hypothetical protein